MLDHPASVAVLLAFATLFRAVFVLQAHAQVSDYAGYHQMAVGLANGEGYLYQQAATAYWPVGWPLWLAAWYAALGNSVAVGLFGNLVLGLVTLWATYRTAAVLCRNERAARLVLAVLAFYPSYAVMGAVLASEHLLTAAVAVAAWLLAAADHQAPRPWRRVALAGVAVGVAVLTKPQALLIAGVLCLGIPCGSWSLRWRRLGVVLATACAVVAPWTLRNYLVFGEFIAVSTNGGANLLIGNHAEACGLYVESPTVLAALKTGGTEPERDQRMRQQALTWIRAHPADAVRLVPRKFMHLLVRDDSFTGLWTAQSKAADGTPSRIARWLEAANWGYWLVFSGLFAVAAAVWLRRAVRRQPVPSGVGLVVVMASVATYAVFFGAPRFHAPMVPWMAIYVGWLLDAILRLGAIDQFRRLGRV